MYTYREWIKFGRKIFGRIVFNCWKSSFVHFHRETLWKKWKLIKVSYSSLVWPLTLLGAIECRWNTHWALEKIVKNSTYFRYNRWYSLAQFIDIEWLCRFGFRLLFNSIHVIGVSNKIVQSIMNIDLGLLNNQLHFFHRNWSTGRHYTVQSNTKADLSQTRFLSMYFRHRWSVMPKEFQLKMVKN